MGGYRGHYTVPDLAAIRGTRGVSLREIADRTKIGMYYLEAIEKGEFQKLPGGVYDTSYIRQYASAIDYDEEYLLQIYRDLAGPEPQQSEGAPDETTLWRRVGKWFAPVAHGLAAALRRTG